MLKIFLFLMVALVCSAVSQIMRPCNLKNYKCIRDYLAGNSNCRKNVQGSIPSIYRVPGFRFETPYFNSSYIENNLIVKNHNKCFVSEFFYNTVTNKVVLGIDCPNYEIEADRVLIKHRSLQEDVYYFYRIKAVYPLVRMTLTQSKSNRMNLCKANVFTDVPILPTFKVEPKDQNTANYLTNDNTEQHTFERENFYYRGYPLARIFMDYIICDFDCSPVIW